MNLYMRNDEVHLWYLFTGNGLISKPGEIYTTFLSQQEKREMGNMLRPTQRRQFFLTRVFLRSILSGYEPSVHPKAWRLMRTEHGRLYNCTGLDRTFDFNISHSNGLVVVAFSNKHTVGVDVEYLRHRDNLIEKAHLFLTPDELIELEALPQSAKLYRAYKLWTLKEAFLKAQGHASFKRAKEVTFDLRSDKTPTIQSHNSSTDVRDWYFRQLRFMDEYEIAVALRSAQSQVGHFKLEMHSGNFWLDMKFGRRKLNEPESFLTSEMGIQSTIERKGMECLSPA